MGEIAGIKTASLGGYLHCSEKRVRWAEGQVVGKQQSVFPQDTLSDLICLADLGVVCPQKNCYIGDTLLECDFFFGHGV